MSDATIQCVCAEGCATADECERAALCLGSDAGVTFQEARMKDFFTWLFSGQPGGMPADRIVRDRPRSVVQEQADRAWRVKGGLG